MKFLLVLIVLLSKLSFAEVTVQDAPMEWLVTATIQSKIKAHGQNYLADELLQHIFKNIKYDPSTDEMIIVSNKKTHDLRQKLETYLSNKQNNDNTDPLYMDWQAEGRSQNNITIYRTNYAPSGFYFLNHIHTNISKDNKEMKWLKYTPQKTFALINRLMKFRRSKAAVSLNDHDTDKAYDMVVGLKYPDLFPMRGVEWGGKTHMGLVGIKENWDNLSHGREYEEEESIRQSRSSEGFRILNHPNKKNKPFHYSSWLDVNGVEVWNTIVENSPLFIFKVQRSYNRDAFQQWVDALKTGMTYTAVGGSDFHFSIPCLRDRVLMYPANYIPGEEVSNTKNYLMQGRSSFVTRPTAPKLTLQAKFKEQEKWANMGDKIQGSQQLEVQLFGDFSDTNKKLGGACYNVVNKFYRLFTFWKKRIWELRFYNLKGDLIAKRRVYPGNYRYNRHLKATLELDITGTDLVRAELWEINKKSKSVDLLGATNPIYINW